LNLSEEFHELTKWPGDFRSMTLITLKDGLIVEGWNSWNLGALLESLK
jgi:hypothetical protein